jgi:RNA polymerase sigma-70 factor (ECF subfamily)
MTLTLNPLAHDQQPVVRKLWVGLAGSASHPRRFAPYVRPALINGAAGVVAFDGERPAAVLAFTAVDDRAVAIDVFNDP